MASHQALLIIDYTNDFVADGGALTCGQPGQALAPTIVKLANQMATASDWVLLPTDVHTPHDPYHPESKLFPPHNVRGTWGRELYGPLKDWYADHQAADNVWAFDKTRYSSFAGTDLDLRLRERHVDTLHLVGVCTDICVLHTVLTPIIWVTNSSFIRMPLLVLTPLVTNGVVSLQKQLRCNYV